MAAWHSLSGYLWCKPTGALSRFKARKRQWYIFEEKQCRLLCYKTEQDAHTKEPIGYIRIRGSSINLNLEEQNHFIIHSEGKEYSFQADNHESMMIWLLGLQAKRDAMANQHVKPKECLVSPARQINRRRESEPVVSWSNIAAASSSSSVGRNNSLRHSDPILSPLNQLRRSQPQQTRVQTMETGPIRVPSSSAIEEEEEEEEDETEEDLANANYGSLAAASLMPNGLIHLENCVSCANTSTSKSSHIAQRPHRSQSLAMLDVSSTLIKRGKQFDANLSLSQSFSSGLLEKCNIDGSSTGSEDYETDEVFNVNYESLIEICTKENASTSNIPLTSSFHKSDVITLPPNLCKATRSPDSGIERETQCCDYLSDDSLVDRESGDPYQIIKDLEKELKRTKHNLEASINQESCLKELLQMRERTIMNLDEKVSRLEQLERVLLVEKEKGVMKSRTALVSTSEKNSASQELLEELRLENKHLREQSRIFQNQNRFLNKEVIKLTNMRYTEQKIFSSQNENLHKSSMEIERWKRDYVSLLQSNIIIPDNEATEGFQLNLFGGNSHCQRIRELLDDARSKNPTLPPFESLTAAEFHVDRYGFKHTHKNEALLLHYICCQLQEHYTTELVSYEEHQIAWKVYLEHHRKNLHLSKELKWLCRKGIPIQKRSEVWRQLVYAQVRDTMLLKGTHYYNSISSHILESEVAGIHRKQISLDLLRTLPTNIRFDHNNADGIKKLQEVLQCFTIHNPEIGYCQGMNFIAGMGLLFLSKEDTFWLLVAFTEKYFPTAYFHSNLIGVQADQLVLKDLLAEKLPRLHAHFQKLDVDISTITLTWFLAVFFDAVPFETMIRIWDCFLLEGPKVLFRFSLAILRIHEKVLLQQQDTISIWKHIKLAAKLTFDVDGLLKTSFEELKPFRHRKEIFSKQSAYLRSLQEIDLTKQKRKQIYQETEKKLRELELKNTSRLLIECMANIGRGRQLICYSDQNSSQLCVVTLDDNFMHVLDVQIDSRILCIVALEANLVLLGSLNMILYAFDTVSQERLWQCRLHDSILDICIHVTVGCQDRLSQNKVFAALADGSIAILENVGPHEPMNNIFYITIESSPVTSLLLMDNELWCASSNTVQIFHAITLDQKNRFHVSNNPFDYILSLSKGQHGIWIAVKGSSIIELWDEESLTCKLLFDVQEMSTCTIKRSDDDQQFNPMRVTALLQFGTSVWVGTGQGDLIVFEVVCVDQSHIKEEKKRCNTCVKNTLVNEDIGLLQKCQEKLTALNNVHRMSRSAQTEYYSSPVHSRSVVMKSSGDCSTTRVFEMNLKKEMIESNRDGLQLEIFFNIQEKDGTKCEMIDKSISTDFVMPIVCDAADQDAFLHDGCLEPWPSDLAVNQISTSIPSSDGNGVNDVDCDEVEEEQDNDEDDDKEKKEEEGTIGREEEANDDEDEEDDDESTISGSQNSNHVDEDDDDDSFSTKNQSVLKQLFDYEFQMMLIVRNKIAESPIRCLTLTDLEHEQIITSCSSFYGEDEAVLKWHRKSVEQIIWTNEPIFEVNRRTKTVQLPSYMKHCLSTSNLNLAQDDK